MLGVRCTQLRPKRTFFVVKFTQLFANGVPSLQANWLFAFHLSLFEYVKLWDLDSVKKVWVLFLVFPFYFF